MRPVSDTIISGKRRLFANRRVGVGSTPTTLIQRPPSTSPRLFVNGAELDTPVFHLSKSLYCVIVKPDIGSSFTSVAGARLNTRIHHRHLIATVRRLFPVRRKSPHQRHVGSAPDVDSLVDGRLGLDGTSQGRKMIHHEGSGNTCRKFSQCGNLSVRGSTSGVRI